MASAPEYPEHGDRSPVAQAQRETHWRRILERRRQSGLTQTEFCRREGLKESSLSWWTRALRERDRARRPAKPIGRRRSRPPFVPVRVIQDGAASPKTACMEIVARSGHIVRVFHGFEPLLLRRVLAALETRPC